VALIRRAGAAIVVVPCEFDDWPEPPANVVHVGRLTDDLSDLAWDSPWAADDERPLVVVTLGTAYALGRDQPANSRRVLELGLGCSLSPDSSRAESRAAIDEVLVDQAIHSRTQQLAETMRSYRGAAGAVEALERLVDASVSSRPTEGPK